MIEYGKTELRLGLNFLFRGFAKLPRKSVQTIIVKGKDIWQKKKAAKKPLPQK